MVDLPLFIPDDIDKYFYNRTDDLNMLDFYLSSVNRNISERILLTGVRGVGKTYILQKILKNAPNNIIITYLDVSKIFGETFGELKEETLLIELLDAMSNSIKEKNKEFNTYFNNLKDFINKLRLNNYDFTNTGDLFGIPIPNSYKNSKKLSKFVMEFPQKFVDNNDNINGFIIILDEFQILKNLENPEAFFWLIRSFNLFQSNVNYVFSESVSNTAEIIEMLNESSGAFGGRIKQINIEPFSKNEVKSYLNDMMKELEFTEDGFEMLYECTRGIPMYINSFCNVLNPQKVYDANSIKETFQIKLNQIMVMWIEVWGSLNEYEKKIILNILPDNNKSWNELLNLTNLSTRTLTKYLKTLQNKGIIEYKEDKYYVVNLMLKKYLEFRKKNTGLYPN